jgi:hypothetical protein
MKTEKLKGIIRPKKGIKVIPGKQVHLKANHYHGSKQIKPESTKRKGHHGSNLVNTVATDTTKRKTTIKATTKTT